MSSWPPCFVVGIWLSSVLAVFLVCCNRSVGLVAFNMRALGWNCRGICNASTVRALRSQKRGYKLDIIFLCEMKANEEHMEYVKRRVRFNEKVVIEAKGRAGGLCLMWKNNVQIEVVEDRRAHV